MTLLRSKRSFSELTDQKGEYVTPCDEQLCEQESSQAKKMDRGEIEVEEERRVRAKRVLVLPTDKEKDESDIVHMTIRSQRETEHSHKCSPKESLVPQVTMDRGPVAHGVHMDPVLIQKIHSAVETCQVLHESSETRAVNGVLENLDTCCLGEVLLKRDVGVCHSDTRHPSMGRTRRKDDGREEFEVFASIKLHERECCERHRNVSDSQWLRVARAVRMPS